MKQFKGQLEGFPEEVVEKMLERQVEQGNERDVEMFERSKIAEVWKGGFNWAETEEGEAFWVEVISAENFSLFFERYPKKPENIYPKVMWVSDTGGTWCKRVVFMEKCGKYLAWHDSKTLEDAEKAWGVRTWNYAKDLEPAPEEKLLSRLEEIEREVKEIKEGLIKF